MINTKVLNMISAIDLRTWPVLEQVMNYTLETDDFDDIDALDQLYRGGLVDGIGDDECRWIVTDDGRKLYYLLSEFT